MNFSVPSAEQVTSGLAGSSTTLSSAPGLAQSSAWNCLARGSVTHARSVGLFGLADVPVVGLAVAFGVADDFAVAVPDGEVVALSSACGMPLLAAVVDAPVAVGTGVSPTGSS